MTFDEIADKYGTDKGSLGHFYGQHYEKHLPKINRRLLEIGAWKGGGIRTFKEWYKDQGEFWVIERFLDGHGLVSIAQLQAWGINAYDIDHDQMWALEMVKDKFTVISEDGSHHWDSQINIFRRMFVHNLDDGGVYVCEDVFSDPYWGRGIIKKAEHNLMGILKRFKETGKLEGETLGGEEAQRIANLIDEVFIYTDIVFITKKK